MSLPRLYALVMGVAYVGVGLYCFAMPDAVWAMWGDELRTPDARVDMQATYGGLDFGVGLFVLWALLAQKQERVAVAASAICIGGFALFRALGMAAAGVIGLNAAFLALELACVAVGAVAYRMAEDPAR